MHAHNDLVPVHINMFLHERHRLRQYVETRSNQVHVQNHMILHNAEHSLVVVAGALRRKINHNASGGVRLDRADGLIEAEHVGLVCVELERGGQVAIVDDVENPVGLGVDLHLAEVDASGAQLHVEAECVAPAGEFMLVATRSFDLEVGARDNVLDLGCVGHSHSVGCVGLQVRRMRAKGNRVVLAIIGNALDGDRGRHRR